MSSDAICYVVLAYLAVQLAVQLFRRRFERTEWIILGFLVAHFLMIQLQMLVREHYFIVEWRYHRPTLPFVLMLFAAAAAELRRIVPRFGTWLAVVLIAVTVALPVKKFCRGWRRSAPIRAEMLASEAWAAEQVRADWKGPSKEAFSFDPDLYLNARRPTVFHPFVAWRLRAGLPRHFRYGWAEEWYCPDPVDYVFARVGDPTYEKFVKSFVAAGGHVVAEKKFGPNLYRLYGSGGKGAGK